MNTKDLPTEVYSLIRSRILSFSILPGVKIGDNSVIGAGSTITEDVPAYSVVAGNPAKAIKKYDSETKLWKRVRT